MAHHETLDIATRLHKNQLAAHTDLVKNRKSIYKLSIGTSGEAQAKEAYTLTAHLHATDRQARPPRSKSRSPRQSVYLIASCATQERGSPRVRAGAGPNETSALSPVCMCMHTRPGVQTTPEPGTAHQLRLRHLARHERP